MSFAPHPSVQVLEKAAAHRPGVWVLKQHICDPDEPVLVRLLEIACLHAELPKKSMVIHQVECWETAAWDVEQSRYITQLWRLGTQSGMRQQDQEPHPEEAQQLLDC
jgi:hypothetical protein